MPKINIENILEELDNEVKQVLEDTIKEHLPKSNFDSSQLCRDFIRNVGLKCNPWEEVPDDCVEKR